MAKNFDLKYLLIVLFLCISTQSKAQINSPISLSISYFGETITHPGIKLSFNYSLKHWNKGQHMQSIYLSFSIGAFFHKRYQKSLFIIPEINFGKQNSNGNLVTTGVGFGYLHVNVPNTYEYNPISGKVTKIKANHNYLLSSYSFSFGKEVMFNKEKFSNIFIKPSFMYAFPNFPKGIGYFNLELGTTINLNQNE